MCVILRLILVIVLIYLAFLVIIALFQVLDVESCKRENVDCSFIGSSAEPFGININCDAVNFCFVRTSSEFFHSISSWRVKQPNNRSFVACSCEECSLKIHCNTRYCRIVSFNWMRLFHFKIFINVDSYIFPFVFSNHARYVFSGA